jgi:hypothetical protein
MDGDRLKIESIKTLRDPSSALSLTTALFIFAGFHSDFKSSFSSFAANLMHRHKTVGLISYC